MEMLSFAFMQRALIAVLLIGLVSSIASFFVILRRLAFIGAGISHSAFGGIALGLVLGINPLGTAGIFGVLVAIFVAWLSRKGAVYEDTAIGIFFSGAMALGIALLSLGKGYYGDAMSYLFGNVLAVSTADLWILALTGLMVLTFLLSYFRALLCLSFNEECAKASGLPVNFLYYGLMISLALTVVVAAKTVGVVLASALLVVPGAIGFQLSKDYKTILVVSIISSLVSALAGLWLSYQFGLASGASIVLVATLIFFLAFLFSPKRSGVFR